MKFVISWDKYKHWQGVKIKVYRDPYPIDNPSRKFQAIAVMLGKRISLVL